MQIWTIQTGFKAFECEFEPFKRNSKHSKIIQSILNQILTNRKDSKYLNANSNNSKGIRSIREEFEGF